jgi:hypothetical protein
MICIYSLSGLKLNSSMLRQANGVPLLKSRHTFVRIWTDDLGKELLFWELIPVRAD